MAQMFPRQLPASVRQDPKRGAEVRVYDGLERTLTDAFRVFYGVAWLMKDPRRGPRDGEADFVIAHEDHGLLVLEVKGGRVGRDGTTGRWTSTDRAGTVHEIKDPFGQASELKYDLIAKVRESREWRGGFLAIGHGVILPDSHVEAGWLTMNGPSDLAISRGHMEDLGAAVLSVYRAWRRDGAGLTPLGASGLDFVTRLLARSFDLRIPLGVAICEEERQIVHLTEEQFALLDVLGRNRRVAIDGGAGTGKTMLAVEKAKRLAREGLRVLLTCFNRPLAESLRSSLLGVDGVSVFTFHALCVHAAGEAGIPLRERTENAPSEYFEQELPAALCAALETGRFELYDALLVDEGQDFSPTWWPWLELCLSNPAGGIFYLFYDRNQRLYRATTDLPAGMMPASLTKNLRNTRGIHEFVRKLYAGDAFEAAGPEGRPVEWIPTDPRRSWFDIVPEVLAKLVVDEKVPAGHVAILTPSRTDVRRLLPEKMGTLGRIPATTDGVAHPTFALVDTIKKFKGLERPIVILAGIDSMSEEESVAQLYVGASRAREHLVIVSAQGSMNRMLGLPE